MNALLLISLQILKYKSAFAGHAERWGMSKAKSSPSMHRVVLSAYFQFIKTIWDLIIRTANLR